MKKLKEYLEDLWYALNNKRYSFIGFVESIKYTIDHVLFMWKSSAIKIWDSCFLLDLIEYRLIKLKECLEEDRDDVIRDLKKELGEEALSNNEIVLDREKRLSSICTCLEHYKSYKDPYSYVVAPDFVKEWENNLKWKDNITHKQRAEYLRYLKKVDKIEKESFKNFFKTMAENIETWWV